MLNIKKPYKENELVLSTVEEDMQISFALAPSLAP